MADGEGLAHQLLRQGPPDLHRDDALRVGLGVPDVHLGLAGLYPELGDQLIVPGLVAGDIDIDVLAAQEQEYPAPGQCCQRNSQQHPADEAHG